MSKSFVKLNIEGRCKDTACFVDEIQKEPDVIAERKAPQLDGHRGGSRRELQWPPHKVS